MIVRKFSVTLFLVIFAGHPVWAFRLKGSDLFSEKNVTAEKNKKAVVVFLSARCPCSNSHVETIKKLSQKFSNFGFYAVHANANETSEESKKYFAKQHFAFPVIQDKNFELANALKAYKTPHAFVLSEAGEILFQGGVTNSAQAEKSDKAYLERALEDLEAGRPVATKEVRSLGCIIQRAN